MLFISLTRMTHWSRHDPVMMRQGQTDYWSKMKLKVSPPSFPRIITIEAMIYNF